jgi:hypothetical protein
MLLHWSTVMMDCPEALSCEVTTFAFLISVNFMEAELTVEMRGLHIGQDENNYVN